MATKEKNIVVWSSFITLMLIWGSSFILIKRGLQAGFLPAEVATIRMLAAFLMLCVPAILNLKYIKKEQVPYLFISAWLAMFVPAYLFATGQTRLDSSIVSVLNALTPAFTFLVGISFFRQPLVKMQFLGLLLGFWGSSVLILINSKGEVSINAFAFLILLAALCYGTNVNIVKSKLSDVKPFHLSTVTVGIAGLSALCYLIIGGMTPSIYEKSVAHPWAFVALFALGALGTAAAQLIFNNMLTHTSPVFASAITYFIPLVAVLWGVLDGEILVWLHYVGMGFIIGGILILNKYR